LGSCAENPTEPADPTPGSSTDPPVSLSNLEGTASDPIDEGLLTSSKLGHGPVLSSGSASDSVSFVSLKPGSLPEADSIQIRNLASGAIASTLLMDGGFDPIAIPATVGDTLEAVSFEAQVPQAAYRWIVPFRLPPVVVRTQPPNGKTKVPLNASVIIVFSEPIEIGSATTDNLQLLRNGQPVSVDMTLDAELLRVELRPDVPLSPQTDYTLLVDTGVTDLSGDPLEQGSEITFETTEATLSVIPGDASIAVGVRLQLMARLTNPSGGSETLPPVIWSTSNPSVAEVSADGALTGVSAGSATISAIIDGLEAAATVAVVATSNTAFAQLTAGRNHTCGLTATGEAYCWGSDVWGELGDGGTSGTGGVQFHPVPVIGGHSFAMLAAGTHHTCGQTTSGTILCWGLNNRGQLGDGSETDRDAPTPIRGNDVYVAVTAGLDHTCARSASGVECWGHNLGLALGTWTTSSTPRQVSTAGGLTWAPIDYHARREATGSNWGPLISYGGAALFWWGQPPEGRLALDLATLSFPYAAGAFPRVVDLDVDSSSRCAVTLGGGAHCRSEYADDDFTFMHEHGLGVEVCAGAECAVRGFDVSYWFLSGHSPWEDRLLFEGARQVVNGSLHTCALTLDGAAYCWGAADRGQLGRASDPFRDRFLEEVDGPDPVEGDLTFATLVAGEDHTCGVTWSGETFCWGANGFGQLGDGTRTDRNQPVRVNFQE